MAHRSWPGILAAVIGLGIQPCGAEEIGDISVQADAMYSGNTFHGYAETRVILQNRSQSSAHVVTLVYPNKTWSSYGNSINRLSRTVTLPPGARAMVPLLQPPLPANGDRTIRVEVDRRQEGEVRAPNANDHCGYGSAGNRAATVLISRSLDFDAVGHLFNTGRRTFTAVMATGPPDASTRGGPNTWMPDATRPGETNWLELDYKTPQAVGTLSVYSIRTLPSSGFIELIGTAGTNLARLPMSSSRGTWRRSEFITDFSFPATNGPVKTVRLNFDTANPANIAIDSVSISGPSGSQWADDARASSDNSASASSYAGRSSTDSVEGLRAETPASEWSEDWLAYTPFDTIALRASDLSIASPATIVALGSYLEAGGNIFVFGNNELPEIWRLAHQTAMPGLTKYNVGLGSCFVLPSENPARLDSSTIRTLRDTAYNAAQYWQSLPHDGSAANTALPVVENLKIPIRGIVFIMLVFIIIIGPVNIVFLNRRKRRTWMLWTIPAISLATTLLVFVYSLLREGVTPNTRIAGLTVLDQVNHHAATIGVTGFYCPLTPSGGLQFDSTTEATPLVEAGYGSGTPREVDWTQSQHFGRGWISARVPAHFHLRKSEPRRERLQILTENGHWQVLNGLGAPIKWLWVADAGMKVFKANDVPAGQKAALNPENPMGLEDKSGAPALLQDIGFTARTNLLEDHVMKYLTPRSYIALLDGNPFIENALGSAASAKRTKSASVVFGFLGPADVP